MKNMSQLQVGQWGNVVDISKNSKIRERLQNVGLIEGTRVKCLHKSPWGDPKAFYIRGAVIALRQEDSVNIEIE